MSINITYTKCIDVKLNNIKNIFVCLQVTMSMGGVVKSMESAMKSMNLAKVILISQN